VATLQTAQSANLAQSANTIHPAFPAQSGDITVSDNRVSLHARIPGVSATVSSSHPKTGLSYWAVVRRDMGGDEGARLTIPDQHGKPVFLKALSNSDLRTIAFERLFIEQIAEILIQELVDLLWRSANERFD
jgi:hypothetical protein